MLLLVFTILNWTFVPGGSLLQLFIFLAIFIAAEVQRSKNTSTKLTIVAEFISAVMLTIYLVLFILAIVAKFM